MSAARTFFTLVLPVCVAAHGWLAVAAPTDDAEVFVKRGIDLRKEFKDREALEEFQRAYQLTRTPRIEAQMGAAEQALGRWVDAELHIAAALGATSDPWVIKNRPILEKSLTVIRTHLGNLEIIGGPDGAEVRVDGRPVGRMPLATKQRVAAGSVVIELRAPGYFPVTRTVSISPDELTRETVTLQPSTTASNSVPTNITPSAQNTVSEASARSDSPPPPTPEEANRTDSSGYSWRRPLAWTLAAGAVAFTGGGFAALVVRDGKAKDYNDLVDSSGCMDSTARECSRLKSDGDLARNLAIVAFGVAGAVAVTSAVLFLTTPAERHPSATALRTCGVDWISGGVACSMSF